MAEKKTTKETLTIRLPRPEKGESDTQFVGVNGKTYLVKKGVPVEVPPEVAEVIRLSQEAKDKSFEYIEDNASE